MKPETLEDRARAAGEAVKVGATTQNALDAFNAFIEAETKRDRESRSIVRKVLRWLGRKG